MTTILATPIVVEQTLSLGQTLTVVTQYDRAIFDAVNAEHAILRATTRFERVLRQAIAEGNN